MRRASSINLEKRRRTYSPTISCTLLSCHGGKHWQEPLLPIDRSNPGHLETFSCRHPGPYLSILRCERAPQKWTYIRCWRTWHRTGTQGFFFPEHELNLGTSNKGGWLFGYASWLSCNVEVNGIGKCNPLYELVNYWCDVRWSRYWDLVGLEAGKQLEEMLLGLLHRHKGGQESLDNVWLSQGRLALRRLSLG